VAEPGTTSEAPLPPLPAPSSAPNTSFDAGSEPLLEVRDLTIGLRNRRRLTPIVHGVDLSVRPGERLGVVGESGSGKSLTMLAVMGLLAPPLEVMSGSIRLAGTEVVGASERTLRHLRGNDVAMVYQDPMTSLDPMLRIGTQVAEGLRAHGTSGAEAEHRVVTALGEVGLPSPEHTARMYPHQLSGGMRQRVMIASALIGEPRLLIADEPTTALDVTIQRQILRLVSRLQAERHMAVVWITHDLGVVAQFAQRVSVMYAGRVVETADTRTLFAHPEHPYSAALLGSLPKASAADDTAGPERLPQIPGMPPDPGSLPGGCSFHPRCTHAVDRCRVEVPPLTLRASGSVAACWVPPAEWVSPASEEVGLAVGSDAPGVTS
jgi:oligopeptide/dipeptide ABC transporter ATP-binding protein